MTWALLFKPIACLDRCSSSFTRWSNAWMSVRVFGFICNRVFWLCGPLSDWYEACHQCSHDEQCFWKGNNSESQKLILCCGRIMFATITFSIINPELLSSHTEPWSKNLSPGQKSTYCGTIDRVFFTHTHTFKTPSRPQMTTHIHTIQAPKNHVLSAMLLLISVSWNTRSLVLNVLHTRNNIHTRRSWSLGLSQSSRLRFSSSRIQTYQRMVAMM
jgi:hypothetical protein